MWNEPNGAAWTPEENVTAYIALAKATVAAIKAATLSEVFSTTCE
jgi:hypothetical protein